MQSMGLMYIASSASNIIMATTLKPIVNSTLALIVSLTTSSVSHESLESVIIELDLAATIKTIEATIVAMNCNKEPLKTASGNVIDAIKVINDILTKIADITASHSAGYVSRWRMLDLSLSISQLRSSNHILNKRFTLLCNINSMSPK
tara:strand:- start:307 stop:750 length:444 start_codon:yes stop_codon:yes gene_type:complete